MTRPTMDELAARARAIEVRQEAQKLTLEDARLLVVESARLASGQVREVSPALGAAIDEWVDHLHTVKAPTSFRDPGQPSAPCPECGDAIAVLEDDGFACLGCADCGHLAMIGTSGAWEWCPLADEGDDTESDPDYSDQATEIISIKPMTRERAFQLGVLGLRYLSETPTGEPVEINMKGSSPHEMRTAANFLVDEFEGKAPP